MRAFLLRKCTCMHGRTKMFAHVRPELSVCFEGVFFFSKMLQCLLYELCACQIELLCSAPDFHRRLVFLPFRVHLRQAHCSKQADVHIIRGTCDALHVQTPQHLFYAVLVSAGKKTMLPYSHSICFACKKDCMYIFLLIFFVL